MPPGFRSSRARFESYRRDRRLAAREKNAHAAPDAPTDTPASVERERRARRRHRPFGTLLRELWRLLRPHRPMLLAAMATSVLGTLIGLISPASTKIAIDYILTENPGPAGLPPWLGLPEDPRTLLVILTAALGVIALVSTFVTLWGRWHMTRIGKRLGASLRRRVFEQAARLPLHRVQAIKSGGAASVLREDVAYASELPFSVLYNPVRALVQLVGTLVILAVTDWRLLAGAVALLPVLYASQRAWILKVRPVFIDIRQVRERTDAQVTESFGGMRVVRAFGRRRAEAARFIGANHYIVRLEMLAWWWSRAIETAWALLIPAASALVLLYGGFCVLEGTLTIGDVMMFMAYLLMLLGPLELLTSIATSAQTNLAALDRLLDLLQEPREFERHPQDPPKPPVRRSRVRGEIELRGVSFHYPGSTHDVLREISLIAPAGSTVALVGPSGAGKTTLCNLVARFYDPTDGAVLLDGVDLRTYDVESYRRLLGVVEQDVFLFDGTVAENIAYARRSATPDEVRDAARAAHADRFIEGFEHGYQTLIGERGVRLSGGQRQRIAIARAILADPRILILDEATSNLDSESEALIQRSLRELMRGRTSFVIAHRLSTIRHADRIVVIEDGRLAETGDHESLLARPGRYAELLRAQLGPEEASRLSPGGA